MKSGEAVKNQKWKWKHSERKNEEEEDQKEESWSNSSGQNKTESNGQRSLIREDRGPEMKMKIENKGPEMKWLKWNNRTFEQIMKIKNEIHKQYI